MKLYEYQVKEILSKYDINIQNGQLAENPREAKHIAQTIGTPVVIKSQVLTGGRGKAGGIKIVNNLSDVEKISEKILNCQIKGFTPLGILVLKKVEVKQEFYLSVTFDRKMKKSVIIFSPFGGMDIEEIAIKHPEKIKKKYISELLGLQDFHLKPWLPFMENNKTLFLKLSQIVKKLYAIYKNYDALMVEINPLALDGNEGFVAIDGKMEIDDNALYRQNTLQNRGDNNENTIESVGKKAGFVVIKLQGNISIISNGAGLALSTLDLLSQYHMSAANILDLSGGATPEKVMRAVKVVLQDNGVKGILFNIFGGITRCDEIARGIAGAIKTIPEDIPVVCRLQGTNRKEGIDILKAANLQADTDLEETIKHIVAAVSGG